MHFEQCFKIAVGNIIKLQCFLGFVFFFACRWNDAVGVDSLCCFFLPLCLHSITVRLQRHTAPGEGDREEIRGKEKRQ